MSFYSAATRISCALIRHPQAYRLGDMWHCPDCGKAWRV